MNASNVPIVTNRPCACHCGQRFTPPITRRGQQYIIGHKPAALRQNSSASRAATIEKARAAAKTEEHTNTLNYRFAVQSAKRDLARLTQMIDDFEEKLSPLYLQIKELEARKDKAVMRHLTVATSLECLEAMENGGVAKIIEENWHDHAS